MDRCCFFSRHVFSVIFCFLVSIFPAQAAVNNPGWITETAELVAPEKSKKTLALSKAATKASAQSAIVDEQTVSLQAVSSISDFTQLAEALENDPVRIYQFIRNNFEYVPYYGALKGAHLTLLERSGNDFDQAAVLVELLRAAGYTADYQYGTMSIPVTSGDGFNLASWLGTDADSTIIGGIIASGGIPALNYGTSFTMDRVWVVVDIAGTPYNLDPAFKPNTKTDGIDLTTATGYSQAGLLAAAGGTLGTDSISNLNEAAVDTYLNNLTNTLTTYLKQNHAKDYVRDIVGGLVIVPDNSTALPASMPFTGTPTEPVWTAIPASYVHTVQFQHGGINATYDIPYIAGKKLSITYVRDNTPVDPAPPGATDFGTVGNEDGPTITYTNTNPDTNPTIQLTAILTGSDAFSFVSGGGLNNLAPGASLDTKVKFSGVGQTAGRKNATLTFEWSYAGSVFGTQVVDLTGVVEVTPTAEIYLDDILLVAESTPSGSLTDFVVTVDHPYAASSGAYADQSVTFTLNRSVGTYVLASAFGGDRNSKLLAERQRQLNSMTLQGLANDSNEVITETLNVIGQTWMQQTQLNTDLITKLSDYRFINHHRFGIIGQEEGYFVDVKAQQGSMLPETATAVAGAFQAGSFVASAMEHSVLEQLQGISNPGISTIKIFALNNQNGGKFFLANQANFGTIQPQLTLTYTANDLSQFQTAVNNGSTLVLPENGQVTLNSWTGKGYVDYRVSGSARSLGMIIGGGLNGGFSSQPAILNTPYVQFDNYIKNIPSSIIPKTPAADPVDLNTGAYFSKMTDISIAGAGPRGLSFTRFHNSQQVSQDTTGLGRGWTHNYNIYLSENSDVVKALGKRTPIDAASLIVAAFVTRDLMEATQPTIKSWITGALVADWATDNLLNNAVTVHMGDQGLTYIKLPDGSYAPPPGVTTELVKLGGGTYELRERFGTVIAFNADNKIATLTDVDGNVLTFIYDGVTGKLSQVKDTYNRTLTVGYTGDLLTSVSDQNGRSVVYTQIAEELRNVAGLENANWQYTYDTLHRLKTVIDPVNATIVDNTYDDSDRVITQLAPRKVGTATYKMHYTGLTSSEEDPLGNRTTYYYDFTGRKVAVENSLGEKSYTEYDGQNQPVRSIDPRSNEFRYVYDNNNNLRFIYDPDNNETENVYDVQFRLIDTYDPFRNNTHYGYDAEHHLELTRDGELNETSAIYYPNGLIDTSTDGRTTVTDYVFDTNGYPDTTKVGTRPVVDYTYNAKGEMTDLIDQEGAHTNFIYYENGLLKESTDPLLKKSFYTYYDTGRIHTYTDRNSDVITTDYTPTGKLDTITYQDLSTVQYTYDSRDNLETMIDSLGTTVNTFDAVNRLDIITDAQGFDVDYDYDEAGNVTRITYPGNKSVSYIYDNQNRLETVTIDWLTNQVATYHYDIAGRLDWVDNFNGSITDYDYDNANRLTGLINKKADGTIIASYQFPVLDGNGNRKQEVRQEPLPPSNLPTESVTFNYNIPRNRLDSTTNATFNYDFEGQLSDKSGTPFTFDYAHRLTGIGANIQFNYDGAGNRLKATRSGIVTKYIYDAAGNLLAEADNAGTITKYYIHGAGLLAMVEGSNVYTYHYNAIGSTVAMTDNNENTINAYSYGPYGRVLNELETINQPFKYVGQYGVMYEPGVEFYYMRARYYDPDIGRFISEDPIGFEGGLNLYAYVGGNPVNAIDPIGTWSFSLEAYLGVGGGINISYLDGTLEATGRLGVGLGGGVSYDPLGEPSPHSKTTGSGYIARTSASGGIGLGVGPVSLDATGQIASGNAVTTPVGGNFASGSLSTLSTDGKWAFGIKAGASMGVDIGSYSNWGK